MRSMRCGFIFRSRGPLQKVCHDPARMSGYDCLPGPQTVCFPGGRPHEQNEEVPRMDGSAGRTHTIRTAHMFSLTLPQLLLLSVDFVPHPPWVKHWAPVGAPPHRWRGFPLVVSTNRPWGRPAWTHVSSLVRHEAHGRDTVSLVQTHPQTPSPDT
jgi:hypothetical protein